MGLAHHMNSDQLPPAKLWGPELLQPFGDQPCGCDQQVTAAKGYHVGKNHPGWWGSQLGGRSWQWSLPGNGAKVGWPQLQGLLGSKSELGTMKQPPWLPASAWAKRLYGNTPLIWEHMQSCHHNTCTTIASLRLLPYRLKINNVKKTKEETNLRSSWWCQLMCPPIQKKKIIYTSYKECLQTLSLMCTPYQHTLILYTSFNLNSFDFLSGRQKRTLIAIAYWIYRVVH